MAEYTEREAMTTEKSTDKKIKAFEPHIVIGENIDNPYYSICYYDVEKKEWFSGYSSYNLAFVAKWLKEFFEKVEVDMTEIVRCKDCEHKKEIPDCQKELYSSSCVACSYHSGLIMDGNDFCSYGKRKEGAENE